MKLELFDTNVLLAVILPHREHHLAAREAFVASKELGQASVCVHTLAEAFSTLSGKIAIPAKQAVQVLQLNLEDVQILALEQDDYAKALERMASLGLSGGGIFDALLAEVALRNKCQKLYTFNIKHFIRLGQEIEKITFEPI